MEQKTYIDEKLIEMIKLPGKDRKEALRYVFVNWGKIAQGVLYKMGGEEADVDDAIQEAVVVFDNHIRTGSYEPTGKLRTYFIGICKGRLYSNTRSKNRVDYTDEQFKMDGIEVRQPETLMLEKEQKSIIKGMLDMLDETCREVLKLYTLSYSMMEIAEETGLSNANTARQWVFKCRKRLAALAAKHPVFANYFKDRS